MGRRPGRKSGTKEKTIKYFDYTLLFVIIFLVCFGLVMLYSTSSYNAQIEYGDGTHYLKRQAFACCLGFAAMFVISKIDYHVWKRLYGVAYIGAFLLCVSVIFLGSNGNGSTRWFRLGPLSFQPSEFAKLAVIIFLATVISRMQKEIGMAIAVFAFGAVFIVLASYRAERIKIWLHPENYDKGYQTMQGLYAIGSGGLFGKGLGASMQKLGFVPEAQNDMVFSIICEELGLFGAICLILLFILMLWRFMVIANNAKDLYGALLVVGIMAHIAIQVILNIAVVTNSIPNTGITLPFISYGGTSASFLLAEMGLALSVSRGIQLEG